MARGLLFLSMTMVAVPHGSRKLSVISQREFSSEAKSPSFSWLTVMLAGSPAPYAASFAVTGPKPRQVSRIALESFMSHFALMAAITSLTGVSSRFSLSCWGGRAYSSPGSTVLTRLELVPTFLRASMMMPSCTRMMLLYLPISSTTNDLVIILPPADRKSISIISSLSSPYWRTPAILPVSRCFLSTMQNMGGSGGFSGALSIRCMAGFWGLMVMWSNTFLPGRRSDMTMDCLLG